MRNIIKSIDIRNTEAVTVYQGERSEYVAYVELVNHKMLSIRRFGSDIYHDVNVPGVYFKGPAAIILSIRDYVASEFPYVIPNIQVYVTEKYNELEEKIEISFGFKNASICVALDSRAYFHSHNIPDLNVSISGPLSTCKNEKFLSIYGVIREYKGLLKEWLIQFESVKESFSERTYTLSLADLHKQLQKHHESFVHQSDIFWMLNPDTFVSILEKRHMLDHVIPEETTLHI